MLPTASARALSADEQPANTDAQRVFRQLDENHDGQLVSGEFSAEQKSLFARLLRTADADRDGQLSQPEFAAGLQAQRTAKPLAKKRPSRLAGADELLLLVAMMDANADGLLEQQEVPKRLRPFYLRLKRQIGKGDRRQIRAREIAQAAPRFALLALETVKRLKLDVDLELALLPEKNWALMERLDGSRRPGENFASAELALDLFDDLDTNGDGQVVAAEVPERFADRFQRLLDRGDRDGDQRLSRQEMQAISWRFQAARDSGQMLKQGDSGKEMSAPQESPAADE